ncbi:unnamed protein product [Clonostachys rhizophaga]|uniref:C3H1-type domain-containing protein n=1 Tax=Clonostachys rhizophaga TaxID=160324 RepID=A0A9N9V078_9HYPO|nr:unnamed protein product [Clonostachys rhizophaga]
MDSTPRFFIVRNPGPPGTVVQDTQPGKQSSIVPLIPVDILPPWVKIEGYPRGLSIEQTAGMTSLGGFPPEEGHVRVQLFDLPLAGDLALSGGQQAAPTTEALPQNNNHVIDTPMTNTVVSSTTRPSGKRQKEHGSRGSPTGSRSSENNKFHKRQKFGNYPLSRQSSMKAEIYVNGKNVYGNGKSIYERGNRLGLCQEWCHHGVCKRGNKCTLSHRMPQSARDLRAIGLEKVPRWWMERFGGPGMEGPREQKGGSSNPMGMKRKAAAPLPAAGSLTSGTLLPVANQPKEGLAPVTGLAPVAGLAPGILNHTSGAQKDEELLVKY